MFKKHALSIIINVIERVFFIALKYEVINTWLMLNTGSKEEKML